MTYHVGEILIHPQHGPATISSKPKREFKGNTVTYLELSFDNSERNEPSSRINPAMRILVIEANAEEAGLRPPATLDEANDIISTLTSTKVRAPENWSRRYNYHTNMLASGDIFQVATVVRNLTVRHHSNSLSAAERRMLTKAELLLASELAITWNTTLNDATTRIRQTITEAITITDI